MDDVAEKVKASFAAFFANPPYRRIRRLRKIIDDYEIESKRRQVINKVRFPPLPTGDEALEFVLYLEDRAADARAKLKPTSPSLKALQSRYIDISLALHVEGDVRPLAACMYSSSFSFSPAQRAITAELMNGRIRSKDGTKIAKCSYEYAFARHWLVDVEGNTRTAAISLVADIFHTSQRTAYRQVNKLQGTEEERRIKAVIDRASAYPKRQKNLLRLYCQKLHVFLAGK